MDIYTRVNDCDVYGVPDHVTHQEGSWRNYVLGAQDQDRFSLVSDSVLMVRYWEGGKPQEVLPDWLDSVVDSMFEVAEQAGVKLWGFGQGRSAGLYRIQAPFSFLSPIQGWTFHLSPVLKYDPIMRSMCEYDFWLRNIQQYHRTLRFNKYFFTTRSLTRDGEMEDLQRLQSRWGELVKPSRGKSVKLKFDVPIEGI
jgi:hypothetical protein